MYAILVVIVWKNFDSYLLPLVVLTRAASTSNALNTKDTKENQN
jgi:hypothetical protein